MADVTGKATLTMGGTVVGELTGSHATNPCISRREHCKSGSPIASAARLGPRHGTATNPTRCPTLERHATESRRKQGRNPTSF